MTNPNENPMTTNEQARELLTELEIVLGAFPVDPSKMEWRDGYVRRIRDSIAALSQAQQGERVCKGDLALGSGCGKCSRCTEQQQGREAVAFGHVYRVVAPEFNPNSVTRPWARNESVAFGWGPAQKEGVVGSLQYLNLYTTPPAPVADAVRGAVSRLRDLCDTKLRGKAAADVREAYRELEAALSAPAAVADTSDAADEVYIRVGGKYVLCDLQETTFDDSPLYCARDQSGAAVAVPEGYALVPVVPTFAMRNTFTAGMGSATHFTHTTLRCEDFDSRYAAMLAAAQTGGR